MASRNLEVGCVRTTATSDLAGLRTMRFATMVILLLAAAYSTADEYLWFEGLWRSDADSTIAANPVVVTLPADARRQFDALFGKTTWRISDGVLSASHEGVLAHSAPYFIRPIDSQSFELVLDGEGNSDIFIIRRIAAGFCASLDRTWTKEFATWKDPAFIECYVRVD